MGHTEGAGEQHWEWMQCSRQPTEEVEGDARASALLLSDIDSVMALLTQLKQTVQRSKEAPPKLAGDVKHCIDVLLLHAAPPTP
eukprot:4784803-Prymnesium_polylepis.1